jgi:uncharacterized protein YceH (UPF0502 family)
MEPILGGGAEQEWQPVRTLGMVPRRILGVLLEKAFTTPDAYPLTLKALTTACNQKSNRDPVVEFTEDEVLAGIEALQQSGLAAEVHTDGGRTARYRHLVRKRFPWTEPQLAVMTELWLRGRQQLGELRTRASRMVPLETLEELRSQLQPLLTEGSIRCSGPLERRGVEVDHAFYEEGETPPGWSSLLEEGAPLRLSSSTMPHSAPPSSELHSLKEQCRDLENRVAELESRLSVLESRLQTLLG